MECGCDHCLQRTGGKDTKCREFIFDGRSQVKGERSEVLKVLAANRLKNK
jgi:hypothetical protein